MSDGSVNTSIAKAPGVLLPERFAQWVSATPDSPALRVSAAGHLHDVSYAELDARATALAEHLLATAAIQSLAVADATPLVGIRLPAGIEQMVAVLAVWKAGAAYLPLDTSPERETIILQVAAPAVILDAAFLEAASAVKEPTTKLPAYSAERLAYVMFTSGSTGQPKGVAVTHANLADLIAALVGDLSISSADVWSQMHSFAFGYSLWEIWGAWATGACLTVFDDSLRKDPRKTNAVLVDAQVSVLSLTPSGLAQCLALDDFCLPESLRLLVLSGEAIVPAHIEAWFARFGSAVRVVSTYALTETSGRVCLAEYLDTQPVTSALLGTPVAGVTLALYDEAGAPVAAGETGELFIAGPGLASGYLNDAALTAEKFVVRDGVRWYRSGDRMRLVSNGNNSDYEFVGRVDQQIKRRGYRVEPAEIEAVIRRYPGVHDVAVDTVARDGGEPQLAAWYQLSEAPDSRPEFWPSLGEYQIYDELLYDFMTADQVRVDAYARAFALQAKGKVVLDIGTGQDALLARLALAAGARKVYAVEVIPEAAKRAAALVRQLKQDDRIVVICGDMQSVDIPEAIEICTQGIIGNIGSSDGIVPIWNSARHLFADNFVAVPSRCVTQIAAVELPAELQNPAMLSLAAGYTDSIFRAAGKPFDVRLCVRNFPDAAKLSSEAVFEDLNFQQPMQADDCGSLTLTFKRAGQFSGVLLWTEVETMPGERVDFLAHQQAWLPVYIPLLDVPLDVRAGDVATIDWARETGRDGVFPDYRLNLRLNDKKFPEYITRHHEDALGRNDFYRALHRSLDNQLAEGAAGLQAWVRDQLPDYMQPALWQQLPSLPLNRNGKLDRAALPMPQLQAVQYRAPETPLQQDLAEIWMRLLNVEQIGLGEDFFDSGGDSILAVRLTTEIQRLIDDTVFLAAVFGAPEISALAIYLETNHGAAIAKRYSQASVPASNRIQYREHPPGKALPVSFAQASLWFLDRLYPGSTAANEQFAIRLSGKPDIEKLQSCWRALLLRHDILHTRFTESDEHPLQVADPALVQPFELVATDVRQLAAIEMATVFNLQQGPLLRARLCGSAAEYYLLITVHHILADGLSVEIIRDELAHLYDGAGLARPELQFSDFALWQREHREADSAVAMRYWQQQLHGADYVLNLPQASAHTGTHATVRSELDLPAVVVDALRRHAKAEGASLFVLLMTALRVVLARYTGQHDLLIGSPVTLRQSDQLQSMIGCMVNNVAFRNALPADGAQPFSASLAQERAAVVAALDHAGLPFESIVEALDPPREFGRHPLFQILLMYEDRSAPTVAANGLDFGVEVFHPPRKSYWDMEVTLVDRGAGHNLQAIVNLPPADYDAGLAESLNTSFKHLLTALSAGLDQSLSGLPVTAENPQQALQSPPEILYPPLCLHQLLEAQVRQTPDAIALLSAAGQLTYSALNERANRMAHGLIATGLQPGDSIGLHMSRSIDRCVAIVAAFKAGLTVVPLDRGWPHERLAYMTVQAKVMALLVTEREHAAQLNNALPAYVVDDFVTHDNVADPQLALNPDAPAWVLFTSGSTGQPKGVAYSHAAAGYRVRWMWEHYGFDQQQRFVHRSSCNFIDAYWELFGPLTHGAVVILPEVEADRDPALLLQALIGNEVTHLVAVPSLLQTLLSIAASTGRHHDLHLQSIICSGESLLPELLAELRTGLPAIRVFNTYGTTETWDISVQLYEPDDVATAALIGNPLPGVTAWVLDANLVPVPLGVWGQLHVGGVGLGLWYAGEHAAPLSQNSLNGMALYATGDRVRWNTSGALEIAGRCDRQINVRGFRIEPAEIEQHLVHHPAVARAAVVQRIHPQSGVAYVVAYLMPASRGDKPDATTLSVFVRGWLPEVVVPAEYVWLTSLPLTASGKTDYLNLPEPDWQSAVSARRYVAPVTRTEKQLAAIWQEILGVDNIGRDDDFFALRGHSLMAAQLMSRVCDAFATDLPLQCLFEHPSLRGFAASVDTIRWAMTNAADSNASDADQPREVLRF